MDLDPSELVACGRFYESTRGRIRAYIVRCTGGGPQVDDILQTTYVKFLNSRMARRVEDPKAVAYVYRIASNAVHDYGRALQRRRESPPPSVDPPGPSSEVPSADRIAVRRALDLLTSKQRQVLWLATVEGFSHREVARIMGVRQASVRVMAFRARKRLREVLTGSGDPDGGGRNV